VLAGCGFRQLSPTLTHHRLHRDHLTEKFLTLRLPNRNATKMPSAHLTYFVEVGR
jgi:hypothetical protein